MFARVVPFLLCACLWSTGSLAQEPPAAPQSAAYTQLLKQGVDAFTAGEWQAARDAFERAHAIEPTARTFRGLALCDFELGYYARSIKELEAALSDPRRPLTPELRAQVLRTLERALRDVARVNLVLPDGAKELRVDGRPEPLPEAGVLMLDPGAHTLEVALEDREPITRQLQIDNGTHQNLIFASTPQRRAPELPPPAARSEAPAAALQPSAAEPSAPRVWSWVALGVTGALGAGALGLGIATAEKHAAFSEQRDAYAARLAAGEDGRPPSESLKRSGQRLEMLTNVALAGTAVVGVATVALFIWERPGRESQVSVGVGPLGLRVSGGF